MLRRTLLFLVTIVVFGTGAFASEVLINGRLNYLKSDPTKDSSEFCGSLRFTAQPTDQQLSQLRHLGVRFFEHGKGIVGSRTVYPVFIPFSALETLKELSFLAAIDCAWKPRTNPPLVNSRPQVEADLAWQVNSPLGGTLSGKGVTICDIDTGINYLHASFFNLSNEIYNWLDTDLSGSLTSGDCVDLNGNGTCDSNEQLQFKEAARTGQYGNEVGIYNTDFDFLYNDANNNLERDSGAPDYGESDPCYGERFFLTDDFNDNGILDPGESLLALGDSRVRAIYNQDGSIYYRGINLLDSQLDGWGHGTQVSGIFGGGWKNHHNMAGIAPGVESLHVNYDFADEPPFLIPIEAGLAWSISEGADIVLIEDGEWTWEFLDGSSNLEIMINEYAADQGVIFVVPAGNLASGHMHTHFNSADGEILSAYSGHSILWPSFIWTDPVELSLTVTPPGETAVVLPLDGSTLTTQYYKIYSNVSISGRGTHRMDLRLAADPDGGAISGDWVFNFSGPATNIHGYFSDNIGGWSSSSKWVRNEDQTSTITWPATADSAITIAAYNTTDNADIDNYSSWGPRIDGLMAVDIAAPGRTVYSTSPWSQTDYTSFSGTSGAGPHVAGAAALLKELIPDLDNGKFRKALYQGAAQDEYTSDISRWGAGKLRINSMITAVLSDVTELPQPRSMQISAYPNPFNPDTIIRFRSTGNKPALVRIFDVAGRQVWEKTITTNSDLWQQVTWNGHNTKGQTLASGVFFAYVKQGDEYAVCKMSLVK